MFVSLVFMSASQATYRVEFDEEGKPSLRQIITQDAGIQTDDLDPQDMALFNHSASKFEEEKEQTKKKKEEFSLKEKLMTSKIRSLWYEKVGSCYCKEVANNYDKGGYNLPSEQDFVSFYYRKANFDEIFEIFLNSNPKMDENTKLNLFKFYDKFNTNLDFTPWNK